MREKLSLLKNSSYQDFFDWGIYDKIAARFGNTPPNGGVVFKTTLKLVNHHSSCAKCHYALEVDTYGRGCLHNCTYCYAKDQLTKRGYWNRPMPFPVDLAEIRKLFYTVFETDRPSKWRNILGLRTPLRIGGMSDSFMWLDLRYGITKELMRILDHYKYPSIVFTRSDLVAQDNYMKVMNPKYTSIQFSICGNDEKLTKLIEPGAPTVKKRLEALKTLSASGYRTAVRINPLFPIFPDGYFSDPERVEQRFQGRSTPSFPFFSFDFIDEIAAYSPATILAGFVRLSPTAIKGINNSTGIDLKDFFDPEIVEKNGDKRFSDAEIGAYYSKIKEKCVTNKIRFSTCYIGNGEKDYFQYQKLWDNKNDCCDIVGNLDSFKTTCQAIPQDVVQKHAPQQSNQSFHRKKAAQPSEFQVSH